MWAVDPFNNVAIMDPNTGVKVYVDNGRRLQTYDTVQAFDELPASFVRLSGYVSGNLGTCVAIATPPAGKALIVKTLLVNTVVNPTPGEGNFVGFYVGTGCSYPIYNLNPGGIGATTIPIEPGLVVPAGQSLWAQKAGGVNAEIYGYGYTCPQPGLRRRRLRAPDRIRRSMEIAELRPDDGGSRRMCLLGGALPNDLARRTVPKRQTGGVFRTATTRGGSASNH